MAAEGDKRGVEPTLSIAIALIALLGFAIYSALALEALGNRSVTPSVGSSAPTGLDPDHQDC